MAAALDAEIEALLKTARHEFRLNKPDQAQRLVERAVGLAPTAVPALNLRGMIRDAQGRLAEARADFERALMLEPDNPDALTNKAITHARVGEYAQALALYDRSLALAPEQTHAIYNRSVIRLALGDWIRGFREFESRWEIFPHEARRLTRLAPRWDGRQRLQGKTILLHHEQGYGDTLQFSRYVPLVSAQAGRVILAVPEGLKSLMSTLPGSFEVIGEGAPVPAHDYHCPLMSLPLAFATTPETVPATIPYLRAQAANVSLWRGRLSHVPALRVGLVWAGRRYPPINHVRDIALESLRPLLACGASFVVLQKDLTSSEKELLAPLSNVTCCGEELTNFADTAALIENLDLVMTVDSAVAHLSGALGKPTWVMNRYASCWRWLTDRTDTPWYPTLRLFRQPAFGDWTSVVASITHAAEELMARTAHRTLKPAKPVKKAQKTVGDASPHILERLQSALDLHGRGQRAGAISQYREILEREPEHPAVLHYLGVAHAQNADFADAVLVLTRAVAAAPTDAVVHNHLANALAGQGNHEEALKSYGRSLVLDPNCADAHYNLGVALSALEREPEAIASFERAIGLKRDYPQAHNNLGNLLAESSARRMEALGCYERALALRPTFVDALVNRTNWLRRLHRYEEALEACDAALKVSPESAPLHSSRGATFAALGQDAAALSNYQRALELDPGLSEASWNLGLLQLSRGDYRVGLPLYEARWNVKTLRLKRRFPDRAAWSGTEDIQGKTVLLHSEQGYGDTIQFGRYCRLVTARGARVVLSAPATLQKLLQSMPGAAEVVTSDANIAFDQHCSLMSLPLALGTELKSIPAQIPYLFADRQGRARWAEKLGARVKLRVGIAWAGRQTHANDAHRSIALRNLAHLFDLNVEWISLQRDIRQSDAQSMTPVARLRRAGEELTDFGDTAALIAELDLVISVDTAVAHLAGALGKPVWILLPAVADWRWLQGRADSPWYPSARLYRQESRGDWNPVIARVREHLATLTRVWSGVERRPP